VFSTEVEKPLWQVAPGLALVKKRKEKKKIKKGKGRTNFSHDTVNIFINCPRLLDFATTCIWCRLLQSCYLLLCGGLGVVLFQLAGIPYLQLLRLLDEF